MLGRLQGWLHGHPTSTRGYIERPWAMVWCGNQISSLRYWAWRLAGSRED